jgi:hypothetical protein
LLIFCRCRHAESLVTIGFPGGTPLRQQTGQPTFPYVLTAKFFSTTAINRVDYYDILPTNTIQLHIAHSGKADHEVIARTT